MSREVHVRFCEGLGVKFPRATHRIVTAQSKEILEQEVRPLIEQFMRERGLELSAEKTCITHIEHGFDFLGQNVRKYRNGKRRVLLIKPSSKSITALLEKVRGIVKTNRQAPAGKLVLALNPIIKGWANCTTGM